MDALSYFCLHGSVEIFQFLVEKGMDPSTTTREGVTFLMKATSINNFSIVRYIVETYPEQLHRKDNDGCNALLYCCQNGSVEEFQFFVEKGMDTKTTSKFGQTCLMVAANNNNLSIVRHIVETYPEQLHQKDHNGWNALLCCCVKGSVEIFQFLVEKGMDTETTSKTGQTCLMVAAIDNNFSIVRHIVETYPEQLHQKDHNGWNALLFCCVKGSVEIFQFLVEKGMDPSTTTNIGETCLMVTANNNNFSIVRHIVETYPEQLHRKHHNGCNALLYCCQKGSVEEFQFLVEKGMDTETTTNMGSTCLMIAAGNGNFSMVRHIVETYPEQLHQRDHNGWNALPYCCHKGSVEMFELFVNDLMFEENFLTNAKIILNMNEALSMYIIERYTTQLKSMRWNPLPNVCTLGSLNVFNALVSLGFDPNKADTKGRTCLMYAAAGGHHALVQRILNLGKIDIHATDDDGCTALHHCKLLDTSWEYLVKAGLSQSILNGKGKTPLQEVSRKANNIRKGNKDQLLPEAFIDLIEVLLREYQRDALQQYLSLFNGVTEKYRHIRLVFLGPEGAGKTTLCLRLQGEPVDLSQRCPTNGGNIYQQLYIVQMGKTSWLRTDEGFAIIERFGGLFKEKQRMRGSSRKEILHEDIDDTVWTPSNKRKNTGYIDSAKPKKEVWPIPNDRKNTGNADCVKPKEEGEESVSTSIKKMPRTKAISTERTARSEDELKRNTEEKPVNDQIPLLSNTAQTRRNFRPFALTSKFVSDTSQEPFAFLSLWDMGGHFALHPSIQVFISFHGVYIITINMMKCLQDPQELEKIRNWIRIVGTVSSQNTANKLRQNHPPIIVVGTHMDLVNQMYKDQKERDELVKNLEDDICRIPELSKNKGRAKYSFLHFIQVDNSIADDPAIEKLREVIFDAAELQDQWKRKIPANWISLEREILAIRFSQPVLTLEEVANLDAHCEKPIEDIETIKLFLGFLDTNRSVVYTGEFDTVITNPQWLLNAFSVIITDDQFMPNETDILLKADFRLYREKGLLTNRLVEELFKKRSNESYCNHLDTIIKHLLRFGMIVKKHKFEQADDDDAYIVPSKLETLTDSLEMAKVIRINAKCLTKTLCFQFQGDFLPLETFDKIYAGILQEFDPLRLTSKPYQEYWWQRITHLLLGILYTSKKMDVKSIYRNFGCFAVKGSMNMIVSFHWEQSCIAITLFNHIDDSIPRSVATSTRRKIDGIIKKTLKVCKQDNVAYEYRLHCSYRLGYGDEPREQDDILETEGGVKCLGKECGMKHRLSRDDWLFWLLDLGDSSAQVDSQTQRKIKLEHAEMIKKLSLYIDPDLPKYWRTFQTTMDGYLGYREVHGRSVTSLSDICRTLMDKNIIQYGEYDVLRSSVEDIHVEAANIIDDTTLAINEIKRQGK